MPSPYLPELSRRPARWRRPLLWTVGVLLALEVLYNAVLLTGLLATVINHFTHGHPKVEWSRAWSLVPGRVHVRNLKVGLQSERGISWQLAMDDVRVDLSVSALLKRTLSTDSLHVRGLSVQIRSGSEKPDGDKPQGPPPENPWKVFLHGIQVQDVHALEVKAVKLTGITSASGDLEVVPGHRVSVQNAKVKLGPGELDYADATVAHIDQGSGEFSLETQRKDAEHGLDLITGLTGGRLQFTATHPSFQELSSLTSQLAGISLKGGAGKLEVELHVKEGRLAKGTVIKGSAEPLQLSLGALRLKAPWQFYSDVYTHEGGKDRLGLKLTLGPARVDGVEGLAMELPELLVLLGADTPRLDELPADAHLEVHAKQLQTTWGGARMTGHVHVTADARKLSLEKGKVALHGSQVQLQEISVRTGSAEERNWEGTLTFPEATLDLSPPSAQGRFSGSFSNAAPFVALLTYKGALPGILKPLLTANNLNLSGEVALGETGLKLDKLLAHGQGLELRGSAETTAGAPHAVFLVKLGPLSVGVETGAGGTHVQVFNASRWFREKTGAAQE